VYKKQKPVYYPLFVMPIGPKQKPGKYLQAEVNSMQAITASDDNFLHPCNE